MDVFRSLRSTSEPGWGGLSWTVHYFELAAWDVNGHTWTNSAASIQFHERAESITRAVTCDYLWP
jgi:hypothetical protein